MVVFVLETMFRFGLSSFFSCLLIKMNVRNLEENPHPMSEATVATLEGFCPEEEQELCEIVAQ